MEEANATGFYKGVSSYWHRRKYQKLESSSNYGNKKKVAKLGAGGGANRRRVWRLRPKFRLRVKIPSLIKILTGFRDLYMDWMLRLAGRGSGLSLPEAPVWSKPGPAVSRKVQARRDDSEIKLMFQIYKALVESGEIEAA